MEAQNHILQELKDLDSSLPHLPHPYRLADGYFAGLPEQILLRIKTEGLDAAAETAELSPMLAGINRSMPNHVPVGYFESLDLSWVWGSDTSASEELKNISSLLDGLKKELPFTVPDGYFEKEVVISGDEKPATPARVVKMAPRRWFKYAAAACVIGLVATVYFSVNGKNAIDPNEKSYAWVEKNLKKVETEAIEEFVELAPGDGNVNGVTVSAEVSSLLKNVPDRELQAFLAATGSFDSDMEDDDELFLN